MTGNVPAAYEFITKGLKAKKHIVTSNKAVVAQYYDEFNSLAAENGVEFLFEAAVGGGIPVIEPLRRLRVTNEINEIYGILNGTSNFILSCMFENGEDFDEVLKKAQELGYAEKNATDDVEGYDSARKLKILLSIAFNSEVKYEDIFVNGITAVEKADVDYLKDENSTIKLVAYGRREGDKFYGVVEPVVVGNNHPFYSVNGSTNSVVIVTENANTLEFRGPGAGKEPTGNAIVSDLMDIAKGFSYPVVNKREQLEGISKDLKASYYVRVTNDMYFPEELVEEETYAGKYIIYKTVPMTRHEVEKELGAYEGRMLIARYLD